MKINMTPIDNRYWYVADSPVNAPVLFLNKLQFIAPSFMMRLSVLIVMDSCARFGGA